MEKISIGKRNIGPGYPPLVIAEIGINHKGDFDKAVRMIDDAAKSGCECVKLQTHIIEDEMVPNNVIPGNAKESIWNIMKRCALTEKEELALKKRAEAKGMIFLSTPFSRAAADRLEKLGVYAYKIGSGECNNYPLVEHIARFGKPVILSTGMNSMESIRTSVKILRKHKVPFAIMHCTSIYPTPYDKVRLGALSELRAAFPGTVLGLSDHSLSIYPCIGSISLGASIIEKHFTSNTRWSGPDISISMDPADLKEMIDASRIIHSAMGGTKKVLKEEQPTINFAYACVVAIKDIIKGEKYTMDNIWVKRPGTGEIKAEHFYSILSKRARVDIKKDDQIRWSYIHG